MNTIQTVLGPIRASDLAVTLTHEHLAIDLRHPLRCGRPDTIRLAADVVLDSREIMVDEVLDFKMAGGNAIVEATAIGMGRDVEVLRYIAVHTGVHIVAATGFYVEAYLDKWVDDLGIDELSEVLIRDITTGIEGSPSCAGIIKLASNYTPLAGIEEKCFRAGARAARRTGVVVTTHTGVEAAREARGGTMAWEQLEILVEEGLSPSQVIIGHNDLNPDLENHKELAACGAYVEYDLIGRDAYMSDQERAEYVRAMVEAGYADRVLLSSDLARKAALKRYGGRGYADVLRRFVPLLRGIGLGEATIRGLLIDNPRCALALRKAPESPKE